MNQELTRLIQFAIDEGDYYFAEFIYGESKRFKVERNKEVRYINQDGEVEYINVIELITSKRFIESVARGTRKKESIPRRIREDREDNFQYYNARKIKNSEDIVELYAMTESKPRIVNDDVILDPY